MNTAARSAAIVIAAGMASLTGAADTVVEPEVWHAPQIAALRRTPAIDRVGSSIVRVRRG